MPDEVGVDVLELTAQIVSGHIGNNQVAADAMPPLIQAVYRSLATAGAVEAALDFIICLEDGQKLKTLKRHSKTSYNMTPEQYRAKWNLPTDYPMVASNYTSHRSTLAKGLGSAGSEWLNPLSRRC